MKSTLLAFMALVMTTSAALCAGLSQPATGDLVRDFESPPESTKPRCYWYWLSGNISREGITRDLEAMKRVGIGEAYIGIIYGGGQLRALSEPWWLMLDHAVREATRIGVDIGLFNSPGWSQSGGPWIKPEQAMRYMSTLETRVAGGKHFEGKLPQPQGEFQDLTVLAFPVPAHDADDAAARGAKITRDEKAVSFDFPAPFEARSLVVLPSKEVNTSGELQVSDDGVQYRTLRKFDLARYVGHPNCGPVWLAPIAISFPAVTAKHFRLALNGAYEGEVSLSSAARLDSYAEKQLIKLFQQPQPPFDFYTWQTQNEPESKELVIAPTAVRDISRQLAKDGTLSWDVPPGDWIVLRTVLMPTGTRNEPAPDEASGLEVDKMNREALAHHFESYVGKLLARIPENERKAWKHVVADSYEVGSQNWTDGMAGDFKACYGYDPLPFLPVLTGRLVGSAAQSERFLWDVRRMVADRISSEYVGGLRDLCHKNGLKLWLENYGHWGFCAEFLQYGGNSDELSGEFWAEGTLGSVELRAASSAAHVYGKRQVFAESFTGGPAFRSTPWSLKKRGDWAFCQGVNQTILHVFIHQPWDDRKPGVNADWGTEFNRNNTWFESMGTWLEYLRRCAVLLQQGLPVADVAYFIGENTPKAYGITNPEVPGYDFDYINAEVLMQRATAKDGRLVLADGMSYKLLVILPQDTMRPEVLAKIASLVKAGVAVYATRRPMTSPSMQNYPACDRQVEQLAAELWDKGGIVQTGTVREALDKIKTPPDLDCKEMEKILYTHRRSADTDFYFLSNQTDEALDLTPAFRVTGRAPELWYPDSGTSERLAVYQAGELSTRVPIRLEARASVFVVFRGKAAADSIIAVKHNGTAMLAKWTPQDFTRDDGGRVSVRTSQPGRYELTTADGKTKALTVPDPSAPTVVDGPWQVTFPGIAAPVPFAKLASWTEHADPAIKYFSGTAIYQHTFTPPPSIIPNNGSKTLLDLGGVESLAEVTLNRHKFGTLWKQPFSLDVTDVIKPGANVLEVKVVNAWHNRLLGQKKEPDAFSAPGVFKPWLFKEINIDGPLLPAGLLGPVQLLAIQTMEVE